MRETARRVFSPCISRSDTRSHCRPDWREEKKKRKSKQKIREPLYRPQRIDAATIRLIYKYVFSSETDDYRDATFLSPLTPEANGPKHMDRSSRGPTGLAFLTFTLDNTVRCSFALRDKEKKKQKNEQNSPLVPEISLGRTFAGNRRRAAACSAWNIELSRGIFSSLLLIFLFVLPSFLSFCLS